MGWVDNFPLKIDNGESIRNDAERYSAMLQNFLFPKLEALGVDPNNVLFPTELQHTQVDAVWTSSVIPSIRLFHILETSRDQDVRRTSW